MAKQEVHNITKFTIFSNYGEKTLSLLGEGAFSHVLLYQSMFDHTVRASFQLFDTGVRYDTKKETKAVEEPKSKNINEGFNLTSGEKVELVVEDARGKKLSFEGGKVFVILEVSSSMTNTMKEVHQIDLCMEDYVKNEWKEKLVVTRFDQKVSDTVKEVLSTITKRPLFIDTTITELSIKGNSEKPFDFVTSLCPKSQPEKFPESAGYYQFDTYNGLCFKSLDVMFSQRNPKRKMIFNETTKLPSQYDTKILEVTFSNSLNVINNLKYGALHKSDMISFNLFKHDYDETGHDSSALYLEENNLSFNVPEKPIIGAHLDLLNKNIDPFNHMEDIGVQVTGRNIKEQLPFAQVPTFNHKDVPQIAIKRYYQTQLFAANIAIDGDFDLYPGDLIECTFPEISSLSKTKNISKKKSGKYLIVDVAHLVSPEGCYTKLNIVRDSLDE